VIRISEDFTIPKAIANSRKAEHDINPIILSRWSPRAYSGEGISDEELMQLLEAARWAPSSSNTQPWRFIFAKREDESEFNTILSLLTGSNSQWNTNAAVLILIISKNYDSERQRELKHNLFDAGSAFENLALQATYMGLASHPMAGFDSEKAKELLSIPEGFTPAIMVSIGKIAARETLDEDLRQREIPNQRKPLQDLMMKGTFNQDKA
jgi:nitroreductase